MKTSYTLILGLFLISLTIKLNAQTTVPQVISSNQTWNAAGSPYIVNQNILIKAGSTVKVMPGTKIRGTGSYRIIVEGSLEARGTKDSIIKLDTISFEFIKGAVEYDFKTNKGSVFSYCFFDANGSGGAMTIQNPPSLLINNCKFSNCMWCIYSTVSAIDTNTVRIEKSFFDGSKMNGYVADISGNNYNLEMDECIVKSMTLYLTTWNTITHSYFYNWPYFSGLKLSTGLKRATLKCNTFRKFKSSILEFTAYNSKAEIIIVGNTFDSADYHMNYYVMGKFDGKFICKNNNFLQYNKNSVYVTGGSTPGYADTLIFTKNYWGTTTSSQITKGIWDINDDISVAGLVDYSNYQSTMITDCITDDSEEDFVGTGSPATFREINNSAFSIYPNPANGYIKIESSNIAVNSYKIFTLEGKLIMNCKLENKDGIIDVSSLKTGFYMLEANNNGATSGTQKLIINR